MFLIVIANGVEAAAGFGATLIALTFGAFLYPIDELILLLVPLNFCLSLFVVILYRKEIDRRTLFLKVLPFASLGLLVGRFTFSSLPKEELKIGFGCLIFCLSCFQLLQKKDAIKHSRIMTNITLFLGGIMQGLFASGGPLTVYATQNLFKNKSQFRTNLSLLWLLLNGFLLASYLFNNLLTNEILNKSFMLMPAVLIGMFLGFKVNHLLSERMFKKVIYSLLLMAGLSLILKGLIR